MDTTGVPSWIEVSAAALRHNLALFRSRISPSAGLLAVVKANAYGHGLEPVARLCEEELMVLFLAYRCERILFYILLPIFCGMILSTIYLRYHYVIDILVGVGLAIGCLIFGPLLHRWWSNLSTQSRVS